MNRDIHKIQIVKRLAEESEAARRNAQSAGEIAGMLHAGGKAARLDVARELIKDVVFVEDCSRARDQEASKNECR